MRKFLAFFYKDLHWKLLSLVLAFSLWFIGANVFNPLRNEPFHMPLQLHNFEVLSRDRLVLVNEEELRDTIVNIVIRGHGQDLDNLRSREPAFVANAIVPSINLGAIDTQMVLDAEGVVIVPLNVSVNLYQEFEHLSITPGIVHLEIDAVITERFMVARNIVGGVAPGHELQGIELLNTNVTVTGARSDVNNVAGVGVSIDLSPIHSSTELTLPIIVYCHSGYDMTDKVQLNVTETTARIQILPIDSLNVNINLVGEPAENFSLLEYSFEPNEFYVVAEAYTLEELPYITIDIDIDGLYSDLASTINIEDWLPPGVALRQDMSPHIYVNVTLDPTETRTFSIPREQIRTRSLGIISQILGEDLPINITISGPRSLLYELHYTDIGLDLNLFDFVIGLHDVPLTVTLPDGFNLISQRPILQVQVHEPASEDDNDEYYDYNGYDYNDNYNDDAGEDDFILANFTL
ncbi:MAG: CdaR family protein [Defluviitaleaceae bacterium]|nr:CdaR family protein [Defluviitaleaceae bacterium]